MNLKDLCEPVFLYLCRLSRRHRAGVEVSARQVRADLATLLADARARAALAPDLLTQFNRTEPALLACIDHAVRSSGWPCAARWVPATLATPDDDADRYFAILRENLDDPTESADERLEVLASCAALAFATPNLPEPHRAALDQLRLRLAIDTLGVLSPTSHTNSIDLTRPSSRPVIALVALALSAIAVICAAASFKAGSQRAQGPGPRAEAGP